MTLYKNFSNVLLDWCVCQNRYVIGVVGVGSCFCWVSSASFLCQLEAVFFEILENTPDQAETLLHRLERAAAGIGLHVNAHKTEYMCFNQTGDISTLGGSSLKLVDKEAVSHQPKKTSTRDYRRHGQLSISYRSYGSQT